VLPSPQLVGSAFYSSFSPSDGSIVRIIGRHGFIGADQVMSIAHGILGF